MKDFLKKSTKKQLYRCASSRVCLKLVGEMVGIDFNMTLAINSVSLGNISSLEAILIHASNNTETVQS